MNSLLSSIIIVICGLVSSHGSPVRKRRQAPAVITDGGGADQALWFNWLNNVYFPQYLIYLREYQRYRLEMMQYFEAL